MTDTTDALVAAAVAAFRVTDAAMLTRGTALTALADDGMAFPAIVAALGKALPKDAAPSRATVGFYVAAYRYAVEGELTGSAPAFRALFQATHARGVTPDAIRAAIVTGDPRATIRGLAAAADAAREAIKAEREANKGTDGIAERIPADLATVASPDWAALVGGLVKRADTPEAERRLAVAMLAAVEGLNLKARERKARRAA